MEFYWVNLGTTHKAVVDQNFLWAPLICLIEGLNKLSCSYVI